MFLLDDAFADAAQEIDVFNIEVFREKEIDASVFERLAKTEGKCALSIVQIVAKLDKRKLNILAGYGAKFRIAHRLFGKTE